MEISSEIIIKDFGPPEIISRAGIMNMIDPTELTAAVEEFDKSESKLDFNQEEIENFYV